MVALVTNSSFLDAIAFDGMRKHLAGDFSTIYILDLGGNVRKNPRLSGTTHNVFGIQVGVSINLLIKKNGKVDSQTEIFYADIDESWRKEEKYRFLNDIEQLSKIDWKEISPDKRHTWLTEGLHAEFDSFAPIGTKEAKRAIEGKGKAIFGLYSSGVVTSRDVLTFSYDLNVLKKRVRTFCRSL